MRMWFTANSVNAVFKGGFSDTMTVNSVYQGLRF